MTKGPGHNSANVGGIAGEHLRSFVRRIERLNEELSTINDDKREVFAEAKSMGFDPKIIKRVIKDRRMDTADREEQDALYETYWAALQGAEAVNDDEDGTPIATRARTRDEPAPEPEIEGSAPTAPATALEPDAEDSPMAAAKRRGGKAFLAGIPYEDNPFPAQLMGVQWQQGWKAAQAISTTVDAATGEVIEEASDGTEEETAAEDTGSQPAAPEQAQDPAREDTGAEAKTVAVGEAEPVEGTETPGAERGEPDGDGQPGDSGDDFPEIPSFLKRRTG